MAGQEVALGLQRDSENSGIFTDPVDIGDSLDFYFLHRKIERCGKRWGELFSVRRPDVFYLRGMSQEPAALGLRGIEPIVLAAVVGPGLLHIAD